jgi:hypothetical protein
VARRIPVILMSGYSAALLSERAQAADVIDVLPQTARPPRNRCAGLACTAGGQVAEKAAPPARSSSEHGCCETLEESIQAMVS